jgi:predicted nucleotidyltransferase
MYFGDLTNLFEIELIIEFGETSNIRRNDIDLLIVSNDFEDMFTHKRKRLVQKCIISDPEIDPICITLEEFVRLQKGDSIFAKQILKGAIIYDSRNKGDST